MNRVAAHMFPLVVALYYPFCAASVRPTMPPSEAPVAELWQRPDDLASRDLLSGPWGPEHAPDAQATYTFVERKQHGTNYHGWHQELFRHISPDDVRWASELLAGRS